MEKVRKFATTIRTNWKKSVFFSGVAVYGGRWYAQKLSDDAYMTQVSREAASYGAGVVQKDAPLYRVTVILNPVASGGKARKMYEKHCAPLLNLAGMKVSVMRTESEGQAKDIMEIMADADAVLVAGGDGTLMETVTGLLRRQDASQAARIPIGVLPVGRTNSLAHTLFGRDVDSVRLMAEATMSVVRQLKKPLGVIEVENRSEDAEVRGKKLYCVNRLEVGAWKDARLRADRYWLFGFGLKNYVTYLGSFTSGHKEVLWDCDLNLQYVDNTGDASISSVEDSTVIQHSEQKKSGWMPWLLGGGRQSPQPQAEATKVSSSWTDLGQFNGPQITIENKTDTLEAVLYRGALDLFSFMRHGWSLWDRKYCGQQAVAGQGDVPYTSLTSPQLLLTPNTGDTEAGPGVEKRLCMDGDDVPLNGPVMVTHLKDKIIVFCDKTEAVTESQPSADTPSRTSLGRWTGGVKSSFMRNKSI